MMIEKAEQTRNTKKSNNTNHDKRATQKSSKKRKKILWRILLQVHFNGNIVSRSVSCPPLPATLICWQWGAWSNLGIYEKNEGRKLVWVWHFAAKMPVLLRLWCWADLRLEHFYRSVILQFLFAKMLKVESLSGSKFPFAPMTWINNQQRRCCSKFYLL